MQDFARRSHIHEIDYLYFLGAVPCATVTYSRIRPLQACIYFHLSRVSNTCSLIFVQNDSLVEVHLPLMTWRFLTVYHQMNSIFFWLKCNFVTVKSLKTLMGFKFSDEDADWIAAWNIKQNQKSPGGRKQSNMCFHCNRCNVKRNVPFFCKIYSRVQNIAVRISLSMHFLFA